MTRTGGRLPLWLFWLSATVISGIFVIFCLVAFVDFSAVQYNTEAGAPGAQLNGAMAGALMCVILNTLLALASFMILIRKTWAKSGTGFSYGFLDAAYLFMSCFNLLTGVVLTSVKHMTERWEQSAAWSGAASNALVATYVFAFISAAVFMLTFLALILYRRAVQKSEMSMDELEARLRPGSAQLSESAPSPAGATQLPTSRSATAGAWSLE